MSIRWKKLGLSVVIWAVLEITLTLIGLDDVADFGEFLMVSRRDVPSMVGEPIAAHMLTC